MSNLVTKLNSILASKIAISGALEAKGVEVNNAPFSSYADLISEMSGGESPISLYKCASVDQTNHTWTGYKIAFSNGSYSKEQTITSGLTYSDVTPITGIIYSQDALLSIMSYYHRSTAPIIPTDGLILYFPFETDVTAHKIQSDTYDNGPASLNYIPCRSKTDEVVGKYLECYGTNTDYRGTFYDTIRNEMNFGTSGDFSICFMFRSPDGTSYNPNGIIMKSEYGTNPPFRPEGLVLWQAGNKMVCRCGTTTLYSTEEAEDSNWVNWCIVRKDGIGYWYKDGILKGYGELNGNASSTYPLYSIGQLGGTNQTYCKYDIKAMRIYERALDIEEISNISMEFKYIDE